MSKKKASDSHRYHLSMCPNATSQLCSTMII
jgi:hypothetical protein